MNKKLLDSLIDSLSNDQVDMLFDQMENLEKEEEKKEDKGKMYKDMEMEIKKKDMEIENLKKDMEMENLKKDMEIFKSKEKEGIKKDEEVKLDPKNTESVAKKSSDSSNDSKIQLKDRLKALASGVHADNYKKDSSYEANDPYRNDTEMREAHLEEKKQLWTCGSDEEYTKLCNKKKANAGRN